VHEKTAYHIVSYCIPLLFIETRMAQCTAKWFQYAVGTKIAQSLTVTTLMYTSIIKASRAHLVDAQLSETSFKVPETSGEI